MHRLLSPLKAIVAPLPIVRRPRVTRIAGSIAALILFAIELGMASAQTPPLSLAEAQHAIEVRQGYRLELIASEPLIVDPISARLDHRGRLWVVEMPDYPTGPVDDSPPSGRIKILTDHDDDGRYDNATVFADQLSFATGVQPYRQGAFVTFAGKIAQMIDHDGDDIADETIDLFEGFAEQNQQLRANHPTLGPDGLIYVANGLRGGSVQSVHDRYPRREAALDLRDRDFFFDPEGGKWGAVAGKSQFGLTIDDFSRRLGCSNRNPAMMAPLTLAQIDRDPLLAARDAIADVAAAAERSKVVARGEAWTTSNLHAGQFSAACGVFAPGIFDSNGEWLAVCEPTAYLVQRQRLQRDGSIWSSTREAEQAEFVASSDTWFRPVNLAAAAGQALLVVDMARAVIEHPDFMPPELKQRPDLRYGQQLGRIWQVLPEEQSLGTPSLDSAANAIKWLDSESPWQRQMASQFLLEHPPANGDSIRAKLRSSSASAAARARAAWLLKRHQRLNLTDVGALLRSEDARLRALAIELAHEMEEVEPRVLAATSDADPLVQRTAARFLSSAPHFQDNSGKANEETLAALTAMAQQSRDFWTQRTLACIEETLLAPLALRAAPSSKTPSELLAHWIERMAVNAPQDAAEVLATALQRASASVNLKLREVTLMEGFVDGLRRGRHSVPKILADLPEESAQSISAAVASAGRTALDPDAEPNLRSRSLVLVAAAGRVPGDVVHLLDARTPSSVRAAAVPLALRENPEQTRAFLRDHLASLPIAVRTAALSACVRSKPDLKWLLDEIAANRLPATLIDPATADRLKQHGDMEIRTLAKELLQADSNRARVLARYETAAAEPGNPQVGKKLFKEHCSACHRIDGVGTNVGPDISDTRTKTAEALLASILDPNAAIDASFIQYRVLTIDGRILDGLLIDETADAMTLQQKGGDRITVSREEIDRIQAPGVSLMPEGFEQSLDVKAMSDLLAYLKNWRYLQTEIPGTEISRTGAP